MPTMPIPPGFDGYDTDFHLGPLGALRRLPSRFSPVDTPAVTVGGLHTSLGGNTVRDVLGTKRSWSWSWDMLTAREAQAVKALSRDTLRAPLYLIDPRLPNRLPEQIATGGCVTATPAGAIASSNLDVNWVPHTLIPANPATLPASTQLGGGWQLEQAAAGSSVLELAGFAADGRLNVPVLPGETPEVSTWITGPGTGSAFLLVVVFSPSGTVLSTTSSATVTTSAGEWRKLVVPVPQVPDGGGYLRVALGATSTGTAASFYVTAWQVAQPRALYPPWLQVHFPDVDDTGGWWFGGGSAQVVVPPGAGGSYPLPGVHAAALTVTERTYG